MTGARRTATWKIIVVIMVVGAVSCSQLSEEALPDDSESISGVSSEAREWTLTCDPELLGGGDTFGLSFYLQPEFVFVRIDTISEPIESPVYSGAYFDVTTSALTLSELGVVEPAPSVDQRIYMSVSLTDVLDSLDLDMRNSLIGTLFSGQTGVGTPVVRAIFLERDETLQIIRPCTNLGLQAEMDVHIADAMKQFPDLGPGDALVAAGPIVLEPIERTEVTMALPGIFDTEGLDLMLTVATEVSRPGIAVCFSQESAPPDREFCVSLIEGLPTLTLSMSVIESEPLHYRIVTDLYSAEERLVDSGELSIEALVAAQPEMVSEGTDTGPEPILRVVADDDGVSVMALD